MATDVDSLVHTALACVDESPVRTNEFRTVVGSMRSTLLVLKEVFGNHARHDVVHAKTRTGIASALTRLVTELKRLTAMTWLDMMLIRCGLSKEYLIHLRDLDNELKTLVDLVRLEILANNNELLARYTGKRNKGDPESPRQFWHRMFRDANIVTTDAFGNALVINSDCDKPSAAYISSTMSIFGYVSSETFFYAFPDPGAAFVVSDWITTELLFKNARTVKIPGHTQPITDMHSVGNCMFATASVDCTIKVYEICEKTVILKCVMIGHERPVRAFVYLSRNSKILSVSDDKSLRVWNAFSGSIIGACSLVDFPTAVRESPTDPRVVVYTCSESAFQLTLFDYVDYVVVRRLRLGMPQSVRHFTITESGEMLMADAAGLYCVGTDGESTRITKTVCAAIASSKQYLVFSTNKGVAFIESGNRIVDIDIVADDEDGHLFVVHNMFVDDSTVYVIWSIGRNEPLGNMSSACLKTRKVLHLDTSFLNMKQFTHMVVNAGMLYCARKDGNIFWYVVDRDRIRYTGKTCNDQLILGVGFSSVKIITSGTNIVVIDHYRVRIYDPVTNTESKDITMPFFVVDCVPSREGYVMISGFTIYWYSASFTLLHSIDTHWCLRKLSATTGGTVCLLYDTVSRYSMDYYDSLHTNAKRVAVLAEDRTLMYTHVLANNILAAVDAVVFLAHDARVDVVNADTLTTIHEVHNPDEVEGAAVSGCASGDTAYILHACHRVAMWDRVGNRVGPLKKTVGVDTSVIDIRFFNGYVLGFSTIGTVFVFDDAMCLVKCLVSHPANTVYYTKYKNDTEVIVSDRTGVTKIIVDIISNQQFFLT